jgi:hypothetical protein
MERLIPLDVLVPVENRPGVFAVVHADTARAIRLGYQKLYWRKGQIVRETVTRARTPMEVPLVFVAVDDRGQIVTEVPA